jgi:hypothetical protein
MSAPHHVVVSVPFWRVIAVLTVACLAVVLGSLWLPDGLVRLGLLSREVAVVVILGCLLGGTLAVISGLVWASKRAGPPGMPQLPGTVLAEVRVSAEGFSVDDAVVPWSQVAEIHWIRGRPGGSAASAIPHTVGDAAVRRQSGAVVVVSRDGAERVLAPTSLAAGDALAVDLQAALQAYRSV